MIGQNRARPFSLAGVVDPHLRECGLGRQFADGALHMQVQQVHTDAVPHEAVAQQVRLHGGKADEQLHPCQHTRRRTGALHPVEETESMSVQYIDPPGLSRGSYSHVAVVTGGRTIHVSGQVSMDEQGRVVGTTFEAQAERVLENLKLALAAAGAELRHVVKMNTYVRDLTSSRVKAFREIRGRHFGEHKPASTLVGTPALVHEDLMIEVEVVAVVD